MRATRGTLIFRHGGWRWKYRYGGKDRWESAPEEVRTKRDAEIWRDERRALIATSGPVPHRFTVAALCERYAEWAAEHYQDASGKPTSTVHEVRQALRRLEDVHGALLAAEYGPRLLRQLRDTWIADDLARPTVNKYTRRVVAVFRWGVSRELVPAHVHAALQAVEGLQRGRSAAREGKAVQPAPAASIEAVRARVPAPIRALIDLQLLTGARSGELVGLRPCDIDTSGPVWLVRLTEHKTAHHGRARVIAFGPKAQAVLKPFMLRPADAPLFNPREAYKERFQDCKGRRPNQKPNPRKTARRMGNAYNTGSYRAAIEHAFEAMESKGLEVERWTPHQLRHNAATETRRRYGLEAAQLLLGHATADVTQVYAERDLSLLEKIALETG